MARLFVDCKEIEDVEIFGPDNDRSLGLKLNVTNEHIEELMRSLLDDHIDTVEDYLKDYIQELRDGCHEY